MKYMYTLCDYIPVRVRDDGDGRLETVPSCINGETTVSHKDAFKSKFAAAVALAERKYVVAHDTLPEYNTASSDELHPGDTVYVIVDDDIAPGRVTHADDTAVPLYLRPLAVRPSPANKISPARNPAIRDARRIIHATFNRYVADMDDGNAIYDFVINHIANTPKSDGVALMALHYALMRLEAGEEL